jgi:hypothetical protein
VKCNFMLAKLFYDASTLIMFLFYLLNQMIPSEIVKQVYVFKSKINYYAEFQLLEPSFQVSGRGTACNSTR